MQHPSCQLRSSSRVWGLVASPERPDGSANRPLVWRLLRQGQLLCCDRDHTYPHDPPPGRTRTRMGIHVRECIGRCDSTQRCSSHSMPTSCKLQTTEHEALGWPVWNADAFLGDFDPQAGPTGMQPISAGDFIFRHGRGPAITVWLLFEWSCSGCGGGEDGPVIA